MLKRILITGVSGAVGRRVAPLLAQHGSLLGLDSVTPRLVPSGVEFKQIDLLTDDLLELFADVDVVVHLATSLSVDFIGGHDGRIDLGMSRRVLDTASRAGVGHLVLLSSAMVYGAWPDNPIPLTEDARIRPVIDFGFAVQKAELERLGSEWQLDNPQSLVTVLRPTVTVADDQPGGLATMLRSAMAILSDEGDPPAQFLHADDLATAIDLVVRDRIDGVLNVAPDGWIPAEDLVALAGPKPRIRVPGWMATALAAVRFRTGLAPTPPGLVPYTEYSWVVANDRLLAHGWRPQNSNEEAYVAGHEAGRFDMLTAKRRQQLALGGAAALGVVLLGVVVLLIRRARRRV